MRVFKELFLDELFELLHAEEQLVLALPKLANAALSPNLKKTIKAHLKETREHVHRLNKIFRLLKVKKRAKVCKPMKSLILDCKEITKDFPVKSLLRDTAIIARAQRVEHYEISAYGTARAFAKEMELDQVVDLLSITLEEEAHADKKLSRLAEGSVLTTGINHKTHLSTSGNMRFVRKSPARLTKRVRY